MFPAIDSTLRPEALVQEVLPHYGIGDIVRCRLQARGLNDTYKVEASDKRSYFLRVYRRGWRTRSDIETEIEMLQHLAHYGVSISVPVARTDGAALVPLQCAEGERWAALFTAAPGEPVEYKAFTEEQAHRYGEAAAALHHAADSFAGQRVRPAIDLPSLLERPLAFVTSTISQRVDDVLYLTMLGDRLRAGVDGSNGIEIGFCHGDLHGHNASYADSAFTIYDFDCCGWGYRAYDLAVFTWAFALTEQPQEKIEAMGRSFLQGYRQRRRIGDVDVAAVPAFVALRQIWIMGLHVSIADRFGWGWIGDPYFDHQLKILRDWDQRFLNRPIAEWLLPKAQ